MIASMANWTVRLKGEQLLEKYSKTKYRVSKDSNINYHTVHKYLTGEDVQKISANVLVNILTDGLGLSVEEAGNLRLNEVFEFVSDEEDAAT